MTSAIKSYFQSQPANIVFFDVSKFLFICTLPLWRSINTIFLWVLIAGWVFVSPVTSKLNELNRNKLNLGVMLLLFLVFVYGVLLDLPQNTNNFDVLTKELPVLIFPIVIFSLEKHFFSIKQTLLFLLVGVIAGIIISYIGIILNIFDRDRSLYVEQANYFFEWIYTGWNLVKQLDIHPGYFAVMLVVALSGLLFESSFKAMRNKRISFILLTALLIFFLIQTGSRIAIISLVIIVVIKATSSNSLKRISLTGSILIITTIILAQFEYVKLKFDLMFQGGERIGRWKAILNQIIEKGSFLKGVGEERAFQLYQDAYSSGGFEIALNQKYNAHNQFLEFWITSGLIGVLVYMFVLFYFIQKTRFSGVAGYFIITTIFLSFVESFFDRSKAIIYFSFMFCLLIHQYQEKSDASK
jgi:O-antigen ligase